VQPLTILGASARAAAFSAIRAGFAPVTGDLFADVDLAACSNTTRVDHYPGGLVEVCRGPQQGGWMYTGALENSPDLLERMAAVRPLLGCGADVVRRVRDPLGLSAALARWGISAPQTALDPREVPRDGSWLRKPLRSAGGHHIERFDDRSAEHLERKWYYQRFIEGAPHSAVYVAAQQTAALVGVTRQLVGLSWTRAAPFSYCGSIGPLCLDPDLIEAIEKIGARLAHEFDLQGLFGVDLIVAGREAWPIEVNPRYVASVEVLEWASGQSAVGLHVEACARSGTPDIMRPASGLCGKAVIYAQTAMRVSAAHSEWMIQQNMKANSDGHGFRGWPPFADIPQPETNVRARAPLVTLFARGANEAEVLADLQARMRMVEQRLYGNQRDQPKRF